MRVVHICRSASGGAGMAAARLHAGLQEEGVDSHLLTADRCDAVNHHLATIPGGLAARIRRGLGRRWQISRLSRAVAALGGDYEIFTFPYSCYPLHAEDIIRSADIINLHWVGDFVDWPTFFRKVTAPIVWTLHDKNPFMGGFHYDCDRDWNPQLREIDSRLEKIKGRAVAGRKIEVVTLNEWMMKACRESAILRESRITVIPNGIDLAVFSPLDRKESRMSLGLPLDTPILLFVSHRSDTRRKGLDLLEEGLGPIAEEEKPLLVTVGDGRGSSIESARHWGRTSDQRELARLYSAADALLLPSREDNLPNVMVEALCCGTPVVSFSNGGMREFIRDGLDGVLLDDTTPGALTRGVRRILASRGGLDRRRIRDHAAACFDVRRQARAYCRLYGRIVST